MATTQLFNILNITVPSQGTVAVAHGLNWQGNAVTPDRVDWADAAFTVTADATYVTATNNSGQSATVDVWVQSIHTYMRAFGGSQTTALTPRPFYLAGGAGSAVVGPTYTKTVYLDGVNGNDANDGLASTTALATYAAVIQKFPQVLVNGANVLLNVAGVGGFTSPTAPLSYEVSTLYIPGPGTMFRNSFVIRAAPKCPAAPTTGTTSPTVVSLEEIDQLNALAPGTGYRTRFNCAAGGWVANDLRTQRIFVRVRRAGIDVIPETPVSENTVDSFTIDIPCATEVLITDTVTLVRCSVQFTGPAIDLATLMITGGGSAEVWSDVARAPGNGNTIQGVEFVGAPNFVNFVGALSGCASSGINIHFVNCQITMLQCAWGLTAFYGSAINRFQGYLDRASDTNPIYQTSVYRVSFQAVGTMSVGDQFGAPAWIGCHDCISHYAGSSLRVYGPGSLLSMLGSNSARLMGSGATGSGVWARYGGKIIVQPFPRTQIVGATGALRVGASATVVAYGTGVGQFEEVAGYAGNLYRMNGSVPATPTGDASQIVLSSVA